jgi:hypothetical protein
MKLIDFCLIFNVLLTFTYVWPITLDYSLYSQLAEELEISDDKNNVLDYFRVLNKSTLKEFNDYLYFPDSERVRLKNLAKSMVEFAYDNYMKFAFPLDELNPIYCKVYINNI